MLASPAAAEPRPLLGPSGPVWLGTLTPDTHPRILHGRSLVMVDPDTGELILDQIDLELPGATPLVLRRIWSDDRGWRSSLDDRLLQTAEGVTIELLEEVLTAAPAAPLGADPVRLAQGAPPSEAPVDWPVDTELTGEGLHVLKTAEGWEVRRGELSERYDREGWLLEREGPGVHLIFERKDGRLIRVETGDGRGFDVQSDARGRPVVVRAAEGLEIYYDPQDGVGLRAASTSERGRTRYSYGEDGLISAVIWPDGTVARIRRDRGGRVALLSGPGPLQQRYDWGDSGLRVTDAAGAGLYITRRERNDGTSESVTDGAGRRVIALRDRSGAARSWTDPRGNTWVLRRDEAGQLTSLSAAGGATWRFQWSGGALAGLTDPSGAPWRYRRDSQGRTVAVTDPAGRTLRYPRDPSGQVVAVIRGGSELRLRRDYRGRVTHISTPGGGRVDLDRDGLGRLVKITDPGGQTFTLSDYRGTRAGALTNRDGSTWSLEFDAMGRPSRLEAPSGEALALRRGSLGRVSFIGALFGEGTEYGYRPDGRLTWIRDPLGATTGLIYDPSGRLRALRRPDLSELRLQRDPGGEITAIRAGDEALIIRRSPAGLPVAAGPLRWTWDSRGQLLTAATEQPEPPGDGGVAPERSADLDIRLDRDGDGSVRTVYLGEEAIDLTRDEAGRVIAAVSSRRAVHLDRNAGGAITRIQLDENQPLEIERDARGLVSILRLGLREWRALRDAEGRALKWTAPDGSALSSPRDAEGRPTLVRYPDGSMARISWDPVEDLWTFEDSAGRVIDARRVEKDLAGRAARIETAEGSARINRDGLGRPVSIEGETGTWSWTPELIGWSGGGSFVALDDRGLPVEAAPPAGQEAWGIATASLSYLRDAMGRVTRLLGDRLDAALGYDPAGRLETIDQPGGSWTIEWDLLGRPAALRAPDGEWRILEYGPEGLIGWRDEELGSVDLVHDRGWGWLISGPQPLLIVPDEAGEARQIGSVDYEPVRFNPLGFPDRPWPQLVGWRGALSLFSGGPLIEAAGAWDPSSGTWLDRPPLLPWADPGLPSGAVTRLDGSASPWWDPLPFAPEGPWADPLGLLVAMGELEPALEGAWLTVWEPAAALPWLPGAAATPAPPLCPPRGALPLDLSASPLAALALRAALPPASPVDTDAVIAALVSEEFGELRPLRFAGTSPQSQRPWWPPAALLR